MLKETGINVLQETKVVLNLYLEEIHVIAKSENTRTLSQLEGKKVSVGPEKSGSTLTAEVLLAGFGLKIDAVFDRRRKRSKSSAKVTSTRSFSSAARRYRHFRTWTGAFTS
jgi:TRAP-type uncharacterized transport system substrate-binding protein